MNNDKLMNKIYKVLGEQVVNETRVLSKEQLESVIVVATQNIEEARSDLESNPKYQQLKSDLADLTAGLKDIKKANNARIQLAVILINERGNKLAVGK